MPGTKKTHTAHRKRHGHHQKRTNHFLNVYKPFLPFLVLALVAGTVVVTRLANKPTTLSSDSTASPQTQVLAYATGVSPNGLLNGTNQRRAAVGQSALTINDKLTQAAQAKANDMISRNYWSHNTPDGTPPWAFITNAGYSYSRAGENLACGFDDSPSVITGWYNSPSHRDNMLTPQYTDVGFGIANGSAYSCGDFGPSEQTVIVAMYGTPYTPAANQPAPQQQIVIEQPQPSQPAVNAQETTTGTNSQDKKHSVILLVTDSQGKAAPGVSVTLHSDPQTGITDKNGQVTFSNVSSGKHTIIIEVSGAKSEIPIDLTNEAAEFKKTVAKPELTSNKVILNADGTLPVVAPQSVNRFAILTSGRAMWALWLLILAVIIGGAYMLVKHSIAAHRFFVRGERYILRHKYVDAAVVLLLVALYFLTRTVGSIL